jgi:hypothetical protein
MRVTQRRVEGGVWDSSDAWRSIGESLWRQWRQWRQSRLRDPCLPDRLGDRQPLWRQWRLRDSQARKPVRQAVHPQLARHLRAGFVARGPVPGPLHVDTHQRGDLLERPQ